MHGSEKEPVMIGLRVVSQLEFQTRNVETVKSGLNLNMFQLLSTLLGVCISQCTSLDYHNCCNSFASRTGTWYTRCCVMEVALLPVYSAFQWSLSLYKMLLVWSSFDIMSHIVSASLHACVHVGDGCCCCCRTLWLLAASEHLLGGAHLIIWWVHRHSHDKQFFIDKIKPGFPWELLQYIGNTNARDDLTLKKALWISKG